MDINANESFNSTIWRLAPKHLNSGMKIVEIAAYIAVFNEGYYAILKMMQSMNINCYRTRESKIRRNIRRPANSMAGAPQLKQQQGGTNSSQA